MEEAKQGWSWQAKVAIAAVLFYLIVALLQYMKLQHLPGPYYGGDLYSHHGFALNYFANGLWSDPYFLGEVPFYPWLGNVVFMIFSLLPGLSLMQAEMYVGLITTALSALAFWFLGWQLFKNRNLALALMLFSLVARGIPAGAPNNLPWMITIPLWFAFWLKAEDTGRMRDKILAGVFMGCTGLSHVAFFLAGMGLFGVTIVIETFRQKEKKRAIVNAIKLYGPMLIAGCLVALLFYGPIIVKYHAKSVNPLFEYNGPSIENLGIGWAFKTVFNTTINFSTIGYGIMSVLSIIGLLICVLNWRQKSARYAVIWFVVGGLMPLHHLITRPLLDRWILPTHVIALSLPLMIFAVYGVRTVTQVAQKKWPNANVQRIIIVGVLILFLVLFMQRYNEYRNDRWNQFGEQKDGLTSTWFEMADYITRNADKNAVILTHDETCFAANGFTGRKCVFVRRTHANYFVDVEKRYADGIVMLYGKDPETTEKLLEEYQVDYVLVDAYMMQQNPLLAEPRFEEYLTENNVTFQKVQARKDPSVPNSRVYEMLMVPAQDLNPTLVERMTEVKVAMYNNQPVLQLSELSRP